MDLPALGFKHRRPHTVTDTQGRLRHIRFIISQNRDKQSTGNLRVANRKRNTHSTRDTHVRDYLKPHRIQAFCQVNQQTIRFSFQNRPTSVPHTGLTFANLNQVVEHLGAFSGKTRRIDIAGVNRRNQRQITTHRTQNIRHCRQPVLAGEDTEIMDHTPVRGLCKTNGNDDPIATKTTSAARIHDSERLSGCFVEEGCQSGFRGSDFLDRALNAIRVRS